MTANPRLIVPLFILLVFATTNVALSARLLCFRIEQDGKEVYAFYYDDNGRADPATVWRYMLDEPIMVEEEAVQIVPEPSDSLEAVLAGAIVVRAQHGSSTIASAELTNLTLVRSSADSSWRLSGSEVERTAQVAGLPAVSTAGPWNGRGMVLLPAVVLLVLLVPLLLALVLVVGRRSGNPRES